MMGKILLFTFLFVGFGVPVFATTCAEDLVAGGYLKDYSRGPDPIVHAAYLCSNNSEKTLSLAKELLDGNFVSNRGNFFSLLGFAAEIVKEDSEATIRCGMAILSSKIEPSSTIGTWYNPFNYFVAICRENSSASLNCAYDLISSGRITNKGHYYSKLSLAAETCKNNMGLIQPQHREANVPSYYSSSGRIQRKSLSEITLPDQTSLVMKNEVMIQGDERCGAAKTGVRGTQCWVCQERAKNNDRMLDPRNPRNPEKPRVMKSSELSFKMVVDGSISEVRGLSTKPIVLDDRNDLIKILEANDLHVVLPAPLKE